MGRSKKTTPTRRLPRESASGTELLGRITLAEGETLEDLFVAPANESQRTIPSASSQNDEREEELTHASSCKKSSKELRKSNKRKKKRLGAILDDDDDDGDDACDSSTRPRPTRSRRRRILFEDEDSETEDNQIGTNIFDCRNGREKREVPCTNLQQSRPGNRRVSRLSKSDQTETLERPSEVHIRNVSDGLYHILYSGDASQRGHSDENVTVTEVRRFNLPADQYKVLMTPKKGESDETESRKVPSRLPLRAGKSLLTISRRLKEAAREWTDLAHCVEKGLLIATLQLVAGTWALSIGVGTEAMKACHPLALPLSRAAHAPRYQSARWINSAISELFQVPDGTSMSKNKADSSRPISASDIYKITDNQQILHVLKTKKSLPDPSSLTIEGLVPTLRPYQVAAVNWMLDRERKSRVSEEWKVAWVVLELSEPSSDSCASLVEWTPKYSKGRATVVLYCPIVGWLASSVEEARHMTLGDDENNTTVKGGILADSMGLGKSVELIALILANKRKNETPCDTRRALFTGGNDREDNVGLSTSVKSNQLTDDYLDFGDTETDDGSLSGEGDITLTPPEANTRVVRVTPDVSMNTPAGETMEERFLDENDTVLGSCLCGTVVDIQDASRGPIVLCGCCDEPMHMECAGFADIAVMKRATKELSVRKMYTNEKWSCWKSDYTHCPCCVAEKQDVHQSRATLIVTPPAILEQWEREIQRHTLDENTQRPLKVRVYRGVEKITKSRQDMSSIHPSLLADQDIVLMTFNSLMSDLGHSDDNRFVGDTRGGNLRKRKRYRVVPTPLLSISWHRVCLDESQLVERPTAASAQMALKLKANFRWCVSGTPVGRGKLEDLFGLLLFLGLNPFYHKNFFTKVLDSSHQNISNRIRYLFGAESLFWRSTKANPLVKEQMGVPEQEEKKTLLQFSSIEKHFYERQLQETMLRADNFAERRAQGKQDKAKEVHLLAENLHRLRAACCHPQVGAGGIGKKRCNGGNESSSVGARVLSMEEILVRLIDDAKLKCEESQRHAILHTNGMAALSRLKTEARKRDQTFNVTDWGALHESCRLYLEALELGESNSQPTPILADALLSGSPGFRHPGSIIKRGSTTLEWKLDDMRHDFWARLDFDETARRVVRVKIRPISKIPQALSDDVSSDFSWGYVKLRNCIVEASSSNLGGEFLSVASGSCSSDNWTTLEFLHAGRSKSWRLVFQVNETAAISKMTPSAYFFGVEIVLDEAEISCDSLQRLHSIHNARLSFQSLSSLRAGALITSNPEDEAFSEMKSRIKALTKESKSIETQYMQTVQSLHSACQQRLLRSSRTREDVEGAMKELAPSATDVWDSGWWNDFLALCQVQGSEELKQSVYQVFSEEMQTMLAASRNSGLVNFPLVRDLSGLSVALSARVDSIRSGLGRKVGWKGTKDGDTFQRRADWFKCAKGAHANSMKKMYNLDRHPGEAELYENAHCRICKEDWGQAGPKCKHCVLGDQLAELEPDRVSVFALTTLHNILKGSLGRRLVAESCPDLIDRAQHFFDVLEAQKKEMVIAWRFWRVHLDLLNDMDELNQCKESMRLSYIDEDLTTLSNEELNAVVMPHDINSRYFDHSVRQATALAELRHSKETLRYLQNQKDEHSDQSGLETEQCAVCLCTFGEADRAVLRCGHSFHLPCLEKLKPSGTGSISCPMRCRVKTPMEEVLLASDKRKDDGTCVKRSVQGSWGVKVTKVVSDLLDIKDLGEKAVLFSQWEDMLDIVEEAANLNSVIVARPASVSKIGNALAEFRSIDCTVLMLNVKNGAEGLTIVEARHVLMLEPLLNWGLDAQAINRVCRIGQKHKTTVHRYIVESTVEVKIDEARMSSSEEAFEDTKSAKHTVVAGGVDGGFSSEKDLLALLS